MSQLPLEEPLTIEESAETQAHDGREAGLDAEAHAEDADEGAEAPADEGDADAAEDAEDDADAQSEAGSTASATWPLKRMRPFGEVEHVVSQDCINASMLIELESKLKILESKVQLMRGDYMKLLQASVDHQPFQSRLKYELPEELEKELQTHISIAVEGYMLRAAAEERAEQMAAERRRHDAVQALKRLKRSREAGC